MVETTAWVAGAISPTVFDLSISRFQVTSDNTHHSTIIFHYLQ